MASLKMLIFHAVNILNFRAEKKVPRYLYFQHLKYLTISSKGSRDTAF